MSEQAGSRRRAFVRFALPSCAVVVVVIVAAAAGLDALSPLLDLDEWRGSSPEQPPVADPTAAGDSSPSAAAAADSPTPDAVTAVSDEPTVAAAAGTVRVEAGSYVVGVSAPDADSAVQRRVDLEEYYIDEYEVTNADYERFVQVVGAPAPAGWPISGVEDELMAHAVVGIEWVWADAYCRALGKRLPTEAEWEASARGPSGAIYPWGDNPDVVELSVSTPRPVGSEALNVSQFGVHDTVGGVWEWVDEPYAATPRAGQVVRRGGMYGEVRNGVAMRQVVDADNRSAIAGTGFRCATSQVDESLPAGEFDPSHALPIPIQPAPGPSDSSVFLVDEQFEDPGSGWSEIVETAYLTGYRAPSSYQVEAHSASTQVIALGGYLYDDASVETSAYVDHVGTTGGIFRFGLVFRASGELEPPATGSGPSRPFEFYAFVINPREASWALLHEDVLPFRVIDEGPLPDDGIDGLDRETPVTIRAEMVGVTIRLYVNGHQLVELDTKGWHPAGDVGFFIETLLETDVRVHFENLLISSPNPT